MTLGRRDGAPFFHCHGLWTEADGRAGGGHILPEETVVAEPFAVEAFGIDGAVFTAEPDPETNFKLFGPVAVGASQARKRPAAPSRCGCGRTRILPARSRRSAVSAGSRVQDFMAASAPRSARALPTASIVEPFATELMVKSGMIALGASGALEAELEVVLVDYTGGLAEGRLVRGDNPVLMTMELVLEAL